MAEHRTFNTRLKDLKADQTIHRDHSTLEAYGTLLDGTPAWSLLHFAEGLWVVTVVDQGMWTDPAVHGPFASAVAANQFAAQQEGPDVECVVSCLAPTTD